MSLASLPIELLDNISEHLYHLRSRHSHQATLGRAALVNRTFYRLVNPRLYRTIGGSALQSLKFFRTITARSDLGRLVTKAEWFPEMDGRLQIELGFEILKLCPLLEHLVIDLDNMVGDDGSQFDHSYIINTSRLPFINTLVTLELLAEGRQIDAWRCFWRLCTMAPLKRIVIAAELYRTEWSVPAFGDNQATATSIEGDGLLVEIRNNTKLRLTDFYCNVSSETGVTVPEELSELGWAIPRFHVNFPNVTLDDYEEHIRILPSITSLRITLGHANGNLPRLMNLDSFAQSISASPTAGHLKQLSFPLDLLLPEDAGQWSSFLSQPALRRLDHLTIIAALPNFGPHATYRTFYNIASRRAELLSSSEQHPNKTITIVTELTTLSSDPLKMLVTTFQAGAMTTISCTTTPCTVPYIRQRMRARYLQALLISYLRDPSSDAVKAARQGKPGQRENLQELTFA